MSRVKPVVARTPEELAAVLGLSAADAREWQVRYALLKNLKEIVRKRKITHAVVAERAGTSRTRVTAILNDKLENVSSDLEKVALDTSGVCDDKSLWLGIRP